MDNIFNQLNAISVNSHTENKEGLTYLSWPWAVAEVKKRCPDMTYKVHRFENDLPYVYDPLTGYMVFTEVTIEGKTHEMWLPVMDSKNKAMKAAPYSYKNKYGKEFTVPAATMFDVNKAIMRCLTKNLAMFGLGLYIYAGEDLPESEDAATPTPPAPPICSDCKIQLYEVPKKDGTPWSVTDQEAYSLRRFGRCLCADCMKKEKASEGK